MDFNALQHKLFSLDPTDPKEDLRKLTESASSEAQKSVGSDVNYVQESVEVQEGSLGLDKDYSMSDFAALAGVTLNEGGKWDAFKHGMSNYNKTSAVNTSADSIKKSKKSKEIEKDFVGRRQKLDKERAKTKKESQSEIEALETRVAYLEGVIEQLLESNQKTGSAGQAKAKDPMPKAKPGRTKHPLKDKLVGEQYESIKDELYRLLDSKK